LGYWYPEFRDNVAALFSRAEISGNAAPHPGKPQVNFMFELSAARGKQDSTMN
jgi:hypothetical protein